MSRGRPPSLAGLDMGVAFLVVMLAGAPAAAAQTAHVVLGPEDAEKRLGLSAFQVLEFRPIRPQGRPRLARLRLPDASEVWVKWTPAPAGGAADNAEPRFEIAAYRLQKLFLDEPDLVVPPTVGRVVPLSDYPDEGRGVRATFPGADAVLVVLQLWLQGVTSRGVWDERRLHADTAYARHVANTNILTHLIHHGDANTGNLLISTDPEDPRVFVVDNGIAFSARPSRDGHEWRELRVRRLPLRTVERLRAIRDEDLHALLGVMLQLERRDGELALVEPGPNLAPRRPVRIQDEVIQIGLTASEINGVARRLRALLRDVDRGRIQTF
jgi:hypothetical protein